MQKGLIDTYSEEHRFECELRYVASMNLSGRRKYLVLVEEKRGLKARLKLQDSLILFWNNRKINNG